MSLRAKRSNLEVSFCHCEVPERSEGTVAISRRKKGEGDRRPGWGRDCFVEDGCVFRPAGGGDGIASSLLASLAPPRNDRESLCHCERSEAISRSPSVIARFPAERKIRGDLEAWRRGRQVTRLGTGLLRRCSLPLAPPRNDRLCGGGWRGSEGAFLRHCERSEAISRSPSVIARFPSGAREPWQSRGMARATGHRVGDGIASSLLASLAPPRNDRLCGGGWRGSARVPSSVIASEAKQPRGLLLSWRGSWSGAREPWQSRGVARATGHQVGNGIASSLLASAGTSSQCTGCAEAVAWQRGCLPRHCERSEATSPVSFCHCEVSELSEDRRNL